METTEVSVLKTVSQIEELLARHGAEDGVSFR